MTSAGCSRPSSIRITFSTKDNWTSEVLGTQRCFIVVRWEYNADSWDLRSVVGSVKHLQGTSSGTAVRFPSSQGGSLRTLSPSYHYHHLFQQPLLTIQASCWSSWWVDWNKKIYLQVLCQSEFEIYKNFPSLQVSCWFSLCLYFVLHARLVRRSAHSDITRLITALSWGRH